MRWKRLLGIRQDLPSQSITVRSDTAAHIKYIIPVLCQYLSVLIFQSRLAYWKIAFRNILLNSADLVKSQSCTPNTFVVRIFFFIWPLELNVIISVITCMCSFTRLC